MVLVVTGNVKAEDIFAQAEELYGAMAPKPIAYHEHIVIPQLDSIVHLKEERPIQQSYVFIGHPAPGSTTPEGQLTMAE